MRGNGNGGMLVVYCSDHSKLITQVKSAAKMMVTVVTTQALEAGDVLRRFQFGAKAAQDETHPGNNNN